jgi:hypothetical protein
MANAVAASQSPKPAAASVPVPPEPDQEPEQEPEPVVETINMAGLVLQKTTRPDGECETEVLKEPMIASELIRATRASQKRRGH